MPSSNDVKLVVAVQREHVAAAEEVTVAAREESASSPRKTRICVEPIFVRESAGDDRRLLRADVLNARWLALQRCSATLSWLTVWPRLSSACLWLTRSRHFERLVLLTIVLNSVLMAISLDPIYTRATATGLIDWPRKATPARVGIFSGIFTTGTTVALEHAFLILFSLEAAIKIVATGLLRGPHAYLRSGWNWLDVLVVVCGWLQFAVEQDSTVPDGLVRQQHRRPHR